MQRFLIRVALAAGLLSISGTAMTQPKRAPPLILAAASLQESMTAAADAWAAKGHPRPAISFAASSALARQVEAGAPADLFISADEQWMDELAKRNLIVPATRVSFLGNSLVLVTPAISRARVDLRDSKRLGALLTGGALAMADTDSVPAGKYGKATLIKMDIWDQVSPKVVRAENVRAALALVERGAAPFGIVYATDSRASKAVRVVATFPADSHPPITYPIARLTASTNPQGELFRRYLLSAAGKAIFARYGFSVK